MSCSNCMHKFGFLEKEYGCGNCGFSFCHRCCKQKIKVTKTGNISRVCSKCHDLITNKRETTNKSENSFCPLPTKQVGNVPLKAEKDDRDVLLRERLEKLRDNDKSVPTHSEIEARLANLKGENLSTKSAVIDLPEQKTQIEQCDDLLKRVTDEVEIESRVEKPEEEIQRRLNRLRGIDNETSARDLRVKSTDVNSAGNTDVQSTDLNEVEALMAAASKEAEEDAAKHLTDLEKDEEIAKYVKNLKPRRRTNEDESSTDSEDESSDQIIEKLLDEERLNRKSESSGISTVLSSAKQHNSDCEDDSDILPWCAICNNDAVIKCKSCDGDLFCRRCFVECHEEWNLKNHVTTRFNKKS